MEKLSGNLWRNRYI